MTVKIVREINESSTIEDIMLYIDYVKGMYGMCGTCDGSCFYHVDEAYENTCFDHSTYIDDELDKAYKILKIVSERKKSKIVREINESSTIEDIMLYIDYVKGMYGMCGTCDGSCFYHVDEAYENTCFDHSTYIDDELDKAYKILKIVSERKKK